MKGAVFTDKLISIILLILSTLLSGCSANNESIQDIIPPGISRQQTEETTPSSQENPEDKPSQPIQPAESEEQDLHEIRISVGGQSFTATLAETKAAEEFAAQLPLTLNMSELNGNEKYYYLDGLLSTDSKVPDMIHTGDVLLFGSNCIVLFYEDFSTSYSYTPIAHIEDINGLKSALGIGNVTIIFN